MNKKLFISVVASFLLLVQSSVYVSAANVVDEVASFVVEVSPTKTSVNQAVDLKIKAVDADGTVVKDYNGSIYMSVLEVKELQDVVLPSDSIYNFEAEDQGEVVFSKGFTIKIPGTFTVRIEDINNDNIFWETKIEVSAKANEEVDSTITFSSPTKNWVETSNTVTIVWNAWVKNAKVQLMLDDAKIKEEMSNQNGDFTSFLTLLQPGPHTLKAMVQDIDGKIVAQSEVLAFTYQPWQWGDIQSLDITPSKTLKQWQKATFIAKVGGDITSIELTLRDEGGKEQKLQLDKMQDGTFQKQLLMDIAGSYTVDAAYSTNGENKTQPGMANVTVIEWKGIKEVTYIVDATDKTKLNLAWKPIGDVEYVLVKKWLNKDKLDGADLLTWSTWSIVGFDVSKEWYYLRLFPADEKGEIIGEPSDIIMIEQVQWSAPVCRVQGIQVLTQKIGDQYFLAWTPAENAERYIVYRSDRPVNSIAEMQKVGETSDTKFPYPFDPQAKTESYAYYTVVAMCQDGSSLQLWNTQKVKVGPMTNMLLILLISGMVFGIYRMRKVSN